MNTFTIFHIDGTVAAQPNGFASKDAAEAESEARILASEATATPYGNGEFYVMDGFGNEYGCTETPDAFYEWIRPATATLTMIKKATKFIGVTDARVVGIYYQHGGLADVSFGLVELCIDGRWIRSRRFEELVDIVHADSAPAPRSFAPLRVAAAASVVAIAKDPPPRPKRRGLSLDIM